MHPLHIIVHRGKFFAIFNIYLSGKNSSNCGCNEPVGKFWRVQTRCTRFSVAPATWQTTVAALGFSIDAFEISNYITYCSIDFFLQDSNCAFFTPTKKIDGFDKDIRKNWWVQRNPSNPCQRHHWTRTKTFFIKSRSVFTCLLVMIVVSTMGIDDEESSAWLNLGQWQHQGRLVMTNLWRM